MKILGYLNKSRSLLCLLWFCHAACSVSSPVSRIYDKGTLEVHAVMDREVVGDEFSIYPVLRDLEPSGQFVYGFRFSKMNRHLAFELKGRLLAMGAREVRIVEWQ